MSLLSRLARAFRPTGLDADLEEEQRFHVEARVADLIRAGVPREEAELQARRQFGNRLRIRETSREVRLIGWLESVVRDIQFGVRMLRKNPAVTLAACVSLALAIGASTGAFSLVEALILRPLPVREPRTLIYLTNPSDSPDAAPQEAENAAFSYPLFRRLRDAVHGHAALFAISYQGEQPAVFDGTGTEIKITPQWVSGNTFELLGLRPALGRLLNRNDDAKPGAHPVAVISYGFWQRHFGGDPHALGRWFKVQEKQYQIVGVTQQGFSGLEPGVRTDVWLPTLMFTPEALESNGWQWMRIWGRLERGTSADQLRAMLQPVFTADLQDRVARFMPADEPADRVRRYLHTPIHVASAANGPSDLRNDFTRPLWILTVVVALVLLIACSNVANLLLARITARDHEMALRLSIGAGRGRLIQQLLIESGLIAVAASIIGALLGAASAPIVVEMLSTTAAKVYLDLQPNASFFAFVVLLCGFATALFGLLPALRASGTTPSGALKSGTLRASARIGLLRPLIAAQVGFSFVVLFVAGLLLVTFQKLNSMDLGFAKEGVVLCRVEARTLKKGGEKARIAWQQLAERVRQLNGVQAASTSMWALFQGWSWSENVRVPGRKPDGSSPNYLGVSPGFLETMQISLLSGRDFTYHDADPENPVNVIVNQAFVRRYFPGQSPLGMQFSRQEENKTWIPQVIVGIVRDARYNDLREAPPATVYVPTRSQGGEQSLEVRTSLDPATLTSMLRTELPRVYPGMRLTEVYRQSEFIRNKLTRERLLALLSGFFAIVAMTLAAIGLYGVLNYAVAQRTREIGIRVALGAGQGRTIALVLRNIVWMVAIGLAGGVALGLGLGQFLTTLLFEIKPSDFWGIALPLLCLIAGSALASVPAAIRAARVDPSVALRWE
jgi:putative ABC transport system permease protein